MYVINYSIHKLFNINYVFYPLNLIIRSKVSKTIKDVSLLMNNEKRKKKHDKIND